MSESSIHLVVRRTIRATPQRVFAAWTTPEQLMTWWGPKGVRCPSAEVDLREGGTYRIGNEMPSGDTVWISGKFEVIDRPNKLIYTWSVEPAAATPERVTVRFEAREAGTEVVIVHERITSEAARDQHEHGWNGCLDGLVEMLETPAAAGR